MPRKNRNALNIRAMNRTERAIYEDAARQTDYRDLRKALLEPPLCVPCVEGLWCDDHDGAVKP